MFVFRFLGLLAVAAFAAAPMAAPAALTATLEPSNYTFTQGTAASGFFDLIVTSDATTPPDSVAGYAIILDIVGPSTGVTFDLPVPVTEETSAANGYILPSAPPLAPSGDEDELGYFDIDQLNPTQISAGQEFGAGRIFFEVAANAAPGTYTFTFDTTPIIGSVFNRADLSEIPTTFVNATITIEPAAIPEPSAMLLLALTGVAGVGVQRFRRRKSDATTAA